MQRSRQRHLPRISLGRGWAVTCAGRISAGGNAVAVVICLVAALTAGVSVMRGIRPVGAPQPTRFAPGTPRSVSLPSSAQRVVAAAPVAELTGAVRGLMSEQQGAAARRDYGTGVTSRPVVRLTRTSPDRSWAFGTTVIPVPGGSAAPPWTSLFLAHASGGHWDIALSGTAGFGRMLGLAAASVLGAAEKQLLARFNAVQATPAADATAAPLSGVPTASSQAPGTGGNSPPGRSAAPRGSAAPDVTVPLGSTVPPGTGGLMLPWRAGQAWRLVAAFSGSGNMRAASMFAFSGGDGRVRAAGPGRLYRFCGGRGSDALLEVINPNGSATEYYQLRAETEIPDGSHVTAGTYLGMTGTSLACGGTAPGLGRPGLGRPGADPGPGPGLGRPRLRPGPGRPGPGRPGPGKKASMPLPGAVSFAVIGTGGLINLNGLALGGWVFHEQAEPPLVWAQRAAVRVVIGGVLKNFAAALPATATMAPTAAPMATPSAGGRHA